MILTEEQLQTLLKQGNCSVDTTPLQEKKSVSKTTPLLNKTETFFRNRCLIPMLYDKTALSIVEQPDPIILQEAPKITYKPDFIVLTKALEVWCYEVKAFNGKWTGEKEDDSLKMRFLKGKFPYIRMFLTLVNVKSQEVWEQEITLTGRTRKKQR